MVSEGLMPARVIVSPARRTIETWDLVAPSLKNSADVEFEDRIYEASVESLLGVIRAQGRTTPLMLVGHNPGLESLAATLLRSQDRAPVVKKFPTGTLAVIDLPIETWDAIEAGTGALERFVTPHAIGVEQDGKD